ADFTLDERDLHLLPLAVHEFAVEDAFLQIDHAALAERRNRLAGFRVQLHEAVADGDVDDSLVTLAVGPVGETAARKHARRHLGAAPLVQAVHPLLLAAFRVERDDRPPRTAG